MNTIEIRVSGRVQGVGFRSCVKRIAGKLNVKGVVMNLPDGTVRICATGEKFILEKFVSMIYGCPRALVRNVEIRGVSHLEFDEFVVRRPEDPD